MKPGSINFIVINKEANADIQPKTIKVGDSIQNNYIKLTYTKTADSTLSFLMENKLLNKTEKIEVSLGFYTSYLHVNHFNNDGLQYSGDYIFRPKTG